MHSDKSLDKANELKHNQTGYRSVHYVCELNKERADLIEMRQYKGLLFEIQIRTVLQHAWAEIEHDRNYKFSGVLPLNIRRRLYLTAGLLEIADREFTSIAAEIDAYKEEFAKRVSSGELGTEEITSLSLATFLPSYSSKVSPWVLKPSKPSAFEPVYRELGEFGIRTIDQLQVLLSEEFLASMRANGGTTTQLGLLRKAMMFNDIEKFFSQAWQEKWHEMNRSTKRLLESKYGPETVQKLLERYQINPKLRKKSPKGN